MNDEFIKINIKNSLFNDISQIEDIVSVSLVGSFVDKDDLTGISDIDTIVICKELNEQIFNNCIETVKSIDLKKCGLKNFKVKVNPTFGPLKFDEPNLAVIHLMIYDIKGHRKHVIASPFTCFDWERSNHFSGQNLNSIFPVGALQLRDFIEVRRSMENYIEDLNQNVISYREYQFKNGKPVEKKKKNADG